MKYIRTKDEVREFAERFNLEHYRNCGFNDEEIIKKFARNGNRFADTIEELCDWFIVEGDDNEITYHKTLFSAKTDGKDYILESNEAYTIYGCVLVKGKGLIYVAKMNDKGELKLI